MLRKYFAVRLSAVTVIAAILAPPASGADDSSRGIDSLLDPEASIAEVFGTDELLAGTDSVETPSSSMDFDDGRYVFSPDPAFVTSGPSDGEIEEEVAPRVSFTITDVKEPARSATGVEVLAEESGDVVHYVNEHATGVQLLSAVAERPGKESVLYRLELADGGALRAETNADGSMLFRDPDGSAIGTLAAPWSQDASGRRLRTSYNFTKGILTQNIDYSGHVTYPVISDPNWSYTRTYVMGDPGVITASRVRDTFHSCFSCVFGDWATSGAPKKMPAMNQVVPLRIGGIGNFTVRKQGEWFVAQRESFGWQFRAEPGHIDGAGSTINFDYYRRYTDNKFVQVVSTYIINDFPLGNALYAKAASLTWGVMASKVRGSILQTPFYPESRSAISCASGIDAVTVNGSAGSNWTPGSLCLTKGKYKTILQADGNFVVYKNSTALWSTATYGQYSARLSLQGDNNIVIYSTSGTSLWQSQSYSNKTSTRLVMQSDGNLVLYGTRDGHTVALWQTATYGR